MRLYNKSVLKYLYVHQRSHRYILYDSFIENVRQLDQTTTRPSQSGQPKPTRPNDKLTKYQLDQTTTPPNTNSTKQQLDQIPTRPNDNSTKQQLNQKTSRPKPTRPKLYFQMSNKGCVRSTSVKNSKKLFFCFFTHVSFDTIFRNH
jgi:hypothetical protein